MATVPPLHLAPEPRHARPEPASSSISTATATPTCSSPKTTPSSGTPRSPKRASAPPERVAQALDEEKGPRLVFADGTQSIYLADMSGDGLTDLVRIRNGEVCYWPNLGYGRFGAKVTMDDAPWFDAPGPVRPAGASAWPTSTAAARPTSSICTATACASTSTSPATAGASRITCSCSRASMT